MVKSGFKVCFRGLFGESAGALVRAAPCNVAVYRLGLGFSLGDAFLDVRHPRAALNSPTPVL